MKNVLILCMILIATSGIAQIPVPSPVVSVPIAEQLLIEQSTESKANFAKEIAELEKQTTFFQDVRDKLKNVSPFIKESRKSTQAVEKSALLFLLMNSSVEELKSSNYPNKVKVHPLKILSSILTDLESVSQDLTRVLTPGIFEMTDAERINFLDDLNTALDEINVKVGNTMRSAHKYGQLYASYSNQSNN